MNPPENEGTGHANHMDPSLDGTDHRTEEYNETSTREIRNPLCLSGANIYPK